MSNATPSVETARKPISQILGDLNNRELRFKVITSVAIIAYAISGPQIVYVGSMRTGLLFMFLGIGHLINGIVFERRKNIEESSFVLLSLAAAYFVYHFFDGLLISDEGVPFAKGSYYDLIMLYIYPLAAFFLTGKKKGLQWSLAFMATALVLIGLQAIGLIHLAFDGGTVLQFLVPFGFVTALIYLYEDANEKKEKIIEDQNHAISKTNKLLEEEKERIEQEKSKSDAMLLTMGEGLVVLDKNNQVVLMNEAAEDITGWKTKEVVGKEWSEVVPTQDEDGKKIPKEERVYNAALQAKKRVNKKDLYYVRKDGSRFPVDITAAPVVLNGQVIGTTNVFRDVTREKEIDRSKTEFVSIASHQLRTPLTTIRWYSELLEQSNKKKLDKNQAESIHEVYLANKRMVSLVDSLLNVSRIDLGTYVIEPVKTKMDVITDRVLHELKPMIDKKKIKVTRHFDPKLAPIMADSKLLEIVIENLLTNAIKYTPKSGSVTIGISIKPEGKEQDAKSDRMIHLTIADTGYGIPKDQQSKIFTKLFRADNVIEKEVDGTGLGLYVVKSIIEQSGGKVWFESVEDKGTTFYVELPEHGMKRKEGSKSLTSSI